MAAKFLEVNDDLILGPEEVEGLVGTVLAEEPNGEPSPGECAKVGIATRTRDLVMGSLALTDQIVVSGTNFLTVVLIANLCSTYELGVFSLAWTIVGFLRTAQERMLSAPYLVFAHRSDTDGETFLGSSLTHQACFAAAGGSIVAGLALFFAAKGTPDGMATVMAWLVFSVPLLLARDHIRSICSAHFRYDVSLIINVTVSSTQIMAIGFLWWFNMVSIPSVVIGLGVACLVPTVVWLLRRPQPFRVRPICVRSDWKASWAYSKWLVAARIAGMAGFFVVPWIVFFVMDADAAGAFAACNNLVGLSLMFITGLNNFFQPRTVRAYHDSGTAAMTRSLVETVGVFGVALGAISLAYFFAGGWLLGHIYGSEFGQFGEVTFFLSLSMLTVCVSIACGNGLAALGQPRGYFWGELAYCGVSITLAVGLIPKYGLHGAAWALVGGGVAASVITALTLARLIRDHSVGVMPVTDEGES